MYKHYVFKSFLLAGLLVISVKGQAMEAQVVDIYGRYVKTVKDWKNFQNRNLPLSLQERNEKSLWFCEEMIKVASIEPCYLEWLIGSIGLFLANGGKYPKDNLNKKWLENYKKRRGKFLKEVGSPTVPMTLYTSRKIAKKGRRKV